MSSRLLPFRGGRISDSGSQRKPQHLEGAFELSKLKISCHDQHCQNRPSYCINEKYIQTSITGRNPHPLSKSIPRRLQEEMRKARVDWQLVVYGEAAHSFTNREAANHPAKGAAHNDKTDRRSWEKQRNSSRPTGAYYGSFRDQEKSNILFLQGLFLSWMRKFNWNGGAGSAKADLDS